MRRRSFRSNSIYGERHLFCENTCRYIGKGNALHAVQNLLEKKPASETDGVIGVRYINSKNSPIAFIFHLILLYSHGIGLLFNIYDFIFRFCGCRQGEDQRLLPVCNHYRVG